MQHWIAGLLLGGLVALPALADTSAAQGERLRALVELTPAGTAALRQAAEGGDGVAMGLLGEAYGMAFGGLPLNDAAAADWLSRAAKAGQTWAGREARFFAFRATHAAEIARAGGTLDLARQRLLGDSEPIDADPELEVLAAGGLVEAQLLLAEQLETGRGLPRDSAAAARWYGKAAETGSPAAHAALGRLYEAGQGVPRDPVAAILHHREAANAGVVSSQMALAGAYAFGSSGLERDPVEALKWMALAANRGSEEAAKAFSKLADMTGVTAAAAAIGRAADWQPKAAGRP